MKEKLDNRYQLNKILGEGGMAVVYQATDLLLNRPVAVKILKKKFASDSEFVERIRREARAVARLSHPNIVSIYDMGQDGDTHYLIMEEVSGTTLKNFINQEGPLNPELTLEIACQISAGLIKAHENNIIHCDIKPHNILITEDQKIKVTDFGIARAVNTSQTLNLTESIEGSAHYFSPEQAQGERIGPATDVYSLGVVIYEMLTGEVPYTGDTPISVAVQHVQSSIPDLPEKDSIPAEIGFLVKKAMAKNPEERFSTAEEFKNSIKKTIDQLDKTEKESQIDNSEAEKKSRAKIDDEKAKNQNFLSKVKNKLTNKIDKITLSSPMKYLITILLIIVLVLSVAFLAYNRFMNVPIVEVPEIVSLSLEEGQNKLAEVGLDYNIADEKHHPEIPDGYIVQQQPEAETDIRQTRTVEIFVSAGPEKRTVPDLTGLEERDARIELENSGYKIGEILYEFSDLYAQDEVITTDPSAGESHPLNKKVDLIISMGPSPAQVEVPGMIGMEWREAQNFLQANNLRLGGVREEESSRFPEGLIMEQSLAPGRFVSAGRSIDVTISAGLEEEVNREDIIARKIGFTSAGDEKAEYRIIVEDEVGRDVVWQHFLPPDQEIEIEVYSRGETRYQIMREEEVIYDKSFD